MNRHIKYFLVALKFIEKPTIIEASFQPLLKKYNYYIYIAL